MERQIGEKFTDNGVELEVEKFYCSTYCYYYIGHNQCSNNFEASGECDPNERQDGEDEFLILSYYFNMINQSISTNMFFHVLARTDENIPNPWQYFVIWKDVSGKLSYVFSKGHTSKEDSNMDRMKFLSRLNKTSSLQVINF